MVTPRIGNVEARIMRVLWERGRATAREITEALNESRPIAHSTVQTLLRKLEAKQAVAHDVEDRTFVFRALVAPNEVRRRATRELLDRLFDGSPGGLITYLVKHEGLSEEDVETIRELLREEEMNAEGNDE